MAQPFIGEIRIWANSFAPVGWAFCNGAILQTSQNEALYSLLGSIYGGNGRTTFGLPDLQGRVPVHQGSGPGLTPRAMGQKGGSEQENMTTSQMPAHTHPMYGEDDLGSTATPGPTSLLGELEINNNAITFYSSTAPTLTLRSTTLDDSGDSTAIDIRMPILALNYCIALTGVFPTQT